MIYQSRNGILLSHSDWNWPVLTFPARRISKAMAGRCEYLILSDLTDKTLLDSRYSISTFRVDVTTKCILCFHMSKPSELEPVKHENCFDICWYRYYSFGIEEVQPRQITPTLRALHFEIDIRVSTSKIITILTSSCMYSAVIYPIYPYNMAILRHLCKHLN